MLPDISAEFLKRMIDGKKVDKVAIDVTDGEFSYGFD
jgi:type VI secretion system protein VasG